MTGETRGPKTCLRRQNQLAASGDFVSSLLAIVTSWAATARRPYLLRLFFGGAWAAGALAV